MSLKFDWKHILDLPDAIRDMTHEGNAVHLCARDVVLTSRHGWAITGRRVSAPHDIPEGGVWITVVRAQESYAYVQRVLRIVTEPVVEHPFVWVPDIEDLMAQYCFVNPFPEIRGYGAMWEWEEVGKVFIPREVIVEPLQKRFYDGIERFLSESPALIAALYTHTGRQPCGGVITSPSFQWMEGQVFTAARGHEVCSVKASDSRGEVSFHLSSPAGVES